MMQKGPISALFQVSFRILCSAVQTCSKGVNAVTFSSARKMHVAGSTLFGLESVTYIFQLHSKTCLQKTIVTIIYQKY